MSVLTLILILAFLGLVAYFVNRSPINATFKWIIQAVLVVVAVILVLVAFGVWDEVKNIRVPKV